MKILILHNCHTGFQKGVQKHDFGHKLDRPSFSVFGLEIMIDDHQVTKKVEISSLTKKALK